MVDIVDLGLPEYLAFGVPQNFRLGQCDTGSDYCCTPQNAKLTRVVI